jgi:uncharacterized protein
MKARISIITIGVDDLQRALVFYRDGLGFPTKLAVWSRKDMAHEAKVPLGSRSATEFSLGHLVRNKAEVDALIEQARRAGAVVTDPPHDAFWGGYTGSFQDPDGHLWEIAWNPDMDPGE